MPHEILSEPTLDISRSHYDETEKMKAAIVREKSKSEEKAIDEGGVADTQYLDRELGKVERYQKNIRDDAHGAAIADAAKAAQLAEKIKSGQIGVNSEGQPLHDAHVKKFNSVMQERAQNEAQERLINNPERVQGRRHVETVKNSIYSQNRDVAERMEKLLVDGHDLMQIVDDLRQESASHPITSTPEYRKVADRVSDQLVKLANADFDKKTRGSR